MVSFAYLEKGPGTVSLPHFVYHFSRKMIFMLYSTNWSNFVAWLSLHLEILGNMCIVRSSLIYNTIARHEWHLCDTSATRVKKRLILITIRIKTCSHVPIFTILQVKDYKERNNFILSTTFRNASFPCQNEFGEGTTKTGICNGKSYIKKLYTRL